MEGVGTLSCGAASTFPIPHFMLLNPRILAVIFAAGMLFAADARGEEKKAYTGPACAAPVDDFFTNEVWPKVGAQSCLECHKAGGDAEDSKFVLIDPELSHERDKKDQALRHDRDQFMQMALLKEKDQSRLLLKVTGKLKHGGKVVLKPDSAGYRVLADFVTRLYGPTPDAMVRAIAEDKNATPALSLSNGPFFDGVVMLDERRLLRRITLSLAGRLPTDAEMTAVNRDGLKAFPALLDAMMNEEAFYTRLREAFNDIFLTHGFGDNPEDALSYEYFEKSRGWTQRYDLSNIPDKKERERAGYKIYDDYRDAMKEEPMRLIDYIVRNNHPFTEIVTADYIMVSPYTARGYGIYDEIRSQFKSPEYPYEFIPVKLKATEGPQPRSG